MFRTPMPPAVYFRAAVALSGRFPALAGVDLVVSKGEVVVLEGANGAGKTSLLRACAGLIPVSSGEAVVLGCDLRSDRTAVRRRVGLLGHSGALYDELTAAENVRFATCSLRSGGARSRRSRSREVSDRVSEALERVGLGGRPARTPAGRLSAGQRRRAALAVLIARDPELWLLDEPHAGLDAEARKLMGETVREAASAGATVLLASHEPEETVHLADRFVTLSGGRVTRERTCGELMGNLGEPPSGDADERARESREATGERGEATGERGEIVGERREVIGGIHVA